MHYPKVNIVSHDDQKPRSISSVYSKVKFPSPPTCRKKAEKFSGQKLINIEAVQNCTNSNYNTINLQEVLFKYTESHSDQTGISTGKTFLASNLDRWLVTMGDEQSDDAEKLIRVSKLIEKQSKNSPKISICPENFELELSNKNEYQYNKSKSPTPKPPGSKKSGANRKPIKSIYVNTSNDNENDGIELKISNVGKSTENSTSNKFFISHKVILF